MKKFIMISAIILFFVSYIIVCFLGQEKIINYNIPNSNNIKVECNEKIISCERLSNSKYLKIKIKSKKVGKTRIKIKEIENNKIDYINVYVHLFGVITTGSYLGKCNGDISFIISFYIIALLIIIYLIRNYIKNRKENIYSYRNVKSLGLIIYIICQYIFGLSIFIYDYLNGYNQSIYGFIFSLKDNMSLLILLSFPFAFLITILVMISNIKLIIKEGKSYKNMLGIILGGTICIMIILNTLFYSTKTLNNLFFDFITYLVYMYISYLECILLSTCILGYKASKKIPKYDKDYIIILGCKIKNDGTLTPLLKGRVDKAIEFSKMQKEYNNKNIIFIPSGGKGNDEIISEAQAMKNYLIEQGINKNKIILEDKSTNTYENIRNSNKIIKEENKKANIAFSTTNYHVFRTGIIAANQKILMEGIGSKTKAYYWINAYIREFVATLVSEKKSHIKVLVILMTILLINMLILFLLRNI